MTPKITDESILDVILLLAVGDIEREGAFLGASPREVAQRLRCTPKLVRDRIKAGVPGVELDRRRTDVATRRGRFSNPIEVRYHPNDNLLRAELTRREATR